MTPPRVGPTEGAGSDEELTSSPDHSQLIGRSFFVYTRVRMLAAGAIAGAALLGHRVFAIDAADVERLGLIAAFIAVYDVVAWAFFRRYRDPDAPAQVSPLLYILAYTAVVLDYLSLTAVLWYLGGARSPFTAFYLLHVMVSSVLLSRRAAIALTALAYGLLVSLVVVEWAGVATPRLPVGAVAGAGPLNGKYAVTLIVVNGVLFAMSAFLLLGITRALHHVERRILLANAELVRLSQQRRDFLHIAAHNLRAPIGAVTMFLQNMRSGLAGEVTPKQRDWLERCLRRLGDLGDFMTAIQTLASLESDIVTPFVRLDLVAIARLVVDEYDDVAAQRGQTLTLDVPDRLPAVVGHERLLKEALVNYVTNAIKYTPEGGRIVVRVVDRAPMVRAEVADDGPGIAAEDQERLFQEFVRLSGQGARSRKIKGSGLGLSIVKRVAAAHGGRTGVESEPGKGSTFFLELPALVE